MNPIVASGSINQSWQYRATSSYDEDLTRYGLLPTDIYNRAPIIKRGIDIFHAKSDTLIECTPDEASTIKVLSGETICFKIEATNTKIHIENGILTEVSSSNSDLVPVTFTWMLNGEMIVDDNKFTIKGEYPSSVLYLNTVDSTHSGLYDCQITNEFGSVVSFPITVEVVDYGEIDLILKNIIKNGCAKEDDMEWSVSSGNLAILDIFNDKQEKLTRREQDSLEGYVLTMFPPSSSKIYSLGNTPSVYNEIVDSNKYFSRDLQYIEEGGAENTILYQDIDITDLFDYLNNKIIGVEGLGAKFMCFIGNAISYYKFRYNLDSDIIYDQANFTGSNRFSPDNIEYYTLQIDEYVNCKVQFLYNHEVLLEKTVSDPYKDAEYITDEQQQINLINKFRTTKGYYAQNIEKKIIQFEEIPKETTTIRIVLVFRHKGLILHATDNILDPNPQYQGSIFTYIQGTQFPSTYNVEKIQMEDAGELREVMSPFSNGDDSGKYMSFINEANQLRELMKENGTNRPMSLYGYSRNLVTGLNLFICPWDEVGTRVTDTLSLINRYIEYLYNEDGRVIDMVLEWDVKKKYYVGNIVSFTQNYYQATADPPKGISPNYSNRWTLIPEWDRTKTYQIGNRVELNGTFYEKVVSNPIIYSPDQLVDWKVYKKHILK